MKQILRYDSNDYWVYLSQCLKAIFGETIMADYEIMNSESIGVIRGRDL